MCRRIKQGPKDRGPRKFEFPPKLGLGTTLFLANRPQGQKNCTVSQIWPADHILNPIQERGTRRFEQDLFIIRIEPPDCEAATACKAAESVREPWGHTGEVIKCEEVAVISRNHELALLPRECPDRGHIGVD